MSQRKTRPGKKQRAKLHQKSKASLPSLSSLSIDDIQDLNGIKLDLLVINSQFKIDVVDTCSDLLKFTVEQETDSHSAIITTKYEDEPILPEPNILSIPEFISTLMNESRAPHLKKLCDKYYISVKGYIAGEYAYAKTIEIEAYKMILTIKPFLKYDDYMPEEIEFFQKYINDIKIQIEEVASVRAKAKKLEDKFASVMSAS